MENYIMLKFSGVSELNRQRLVHERDQSKHKITRQELIARFQENRDGSHGVSYDGTDSSLLSPWMVMHGEFTSGKRTTRERRECFMYSLHERRLLLHHT